MELPQMLKGDSPKRLLQGLALGVALTVVVGFSWFGGGFGWYTGDGARALAYQSSNQAVVLALAPLCADRVRASTNADSVIAELAKAESWNRRTVLDRTGFAKFVGNTNSEREVSDACLGILLDAKKI